jgi:hypothetical protein
MMQAYRGTVRGNVVVLDEEVQLEDGTPVEVRVAEQNHEADDTLDPEERAQRLMVQRGLLSEVKRPSRVEIPDRISPIEVPGKPLSEIIIEERR